MNTHSDADNRAKTDLAVANRILVNHGVLDAFGHVSVRQPGDPEHFYLSRNLAPGMVTPADIQRYDFDGETEDRESSYLERFIHAAYHLMGLRTYLTTGEKESRAWTFRAGYKAPQCAGVIHSDFERGFIRAEVIRWDELLEIGSWAKAKDVGKIRVEGKDYEVADGDVLEFRFNV